MAYINKVQIGNNQYLIEPTLFATVGGVGQALTATLENFSLVAGAYIHLLVGIDVIANATLNVNNTGAKTIYYDNAPIAAGAFTLNRVYTLMYDGAHWVVIGDLEEKNIVIGTTAYWQANNTYIAPYGTIIIYTDRGTVNNIAVPGIKISDGLAYAIDLPFVGDDVAAAIRSELNTHINDNIRHITSAERTFWNNKLNCDINEENLIFNRS